ncbi:phosphatase PAP2 family protein [Gymnodinialimonas hymeniacidonis]|uniref:phosphatase PAP2 family protein n=1 Tax=Gymnodinialimonas hymeniacidonis TaxID=3126508 RepID=UPI0034C62471
MRLTLFLLALLVAFVLDVPVHQAVSNAPEGLADAASLITWVGKTDWQALVLITLMVGAAFAGPSPVSAAVLRVAVACFLLILLTGIAVQALKYGFGRPRPAYLDGISPMTFAPFSFQSGWKAFPSGHATTMGALAVLACRIWPGAWAYAWGLAVLVAVSRVLVGVHYVSDVAAGLALGAVLAGWVLDRWRIREPFAEEEVPRAGLMAIPHTFGRLLTALVRPST